jgi:hypothetical protein
MASGKLYGERESIRVSRNRLNTNDAIPCCSLFIVKAPKTLGCLFAAVIVSSYPLDCRRATISLTPGDRVVYAGKPNGERKPQIYDNQLPEGDAPPG